MSAPDPSFVPSDADLEIQRVAIAREYLSQASKERLADPAYAEIVELITLYILDNCRHRWKRDEIEDPRDETLLAIEYCDVCLMARTHHQHHLEHNFSPIPFHYTSLPAVAPQNLQSAMVDPQHPQSFYSAEEGAYDGAADEPTPR